MKKIINILGIIFYALFLPFVMLYHDLSSNKKNQHGQKTNLVNSLFLAIIWLMIWSFVIFLIFPEYKEQIGILTLIFYGLFMIVSAYVHLKDIGPYEKEKYSKWYVENLGKGKILKAFLGQEDAIKFTYWSLKYLSLPVLILGIIIVIIGVWLLLQ